MARPVNGKGHSGPKAKLDRLPDIAAMIDRAKSRSFDARSDLGNIYHAAERDGFHRLALKEAVRLRDMEAAKRRDYLASLNAYCDKLEIWAQGEMFGDEPRPPQPDPDQLDAAEAAASEPVEDNKDAAGYTHEMGRQAGLAGRPLIQNPWPDGVKAHATWHRGWLAGQDELSSSGQPPSGKRRRGRPRKHAPGSAEAQVN